YEIIKTKWEILLHLSRSSMLFSSKIFQPAGRLSELVLNILFYHALFVDEHGHLKIYLPKKLLECLPKCTSLPKERHRWNTNEVRTALLIIPLSTKSISLQR
uniref:Calmodulin binding transcription activator 1 n=1 Tax=Maylandia zebra TaxID=106582 RepID=A0A3P9DLB5_9CICH